MLVDAPTYTFPVERPAYLDEAQALDAAGIPVPADLTRHVPRAAGVAQHRQPRPGLRPLRPHGRHQHRRRSRVVTPPSCASRAPRAASPSAPTATAGSAISSRARAAASPWPRPPATSPVVGATPLAVTDCLNFGSPDDPAVYYQLAEVIEGMAEACRAFETPVVSGNVSLYNESNGQAIWPTPVVGMLGLLDDLGERCDTGFVADGRRHLRARRWPSPAWPAASTSATSTAASPDARRSTSTSRSRCSASCGSPSARDRCARLTTAPRVGWRWRWPSRPSAAASASDATRAGWLAAAVRADVALFGEAQSRIVVSVAAEDAAAFEQSAPTARACPALGWARSAVTGSSSAPIDVGLSDARAAWSGGLANALAGEG